MIIYKQPRAGLPTHYRSVLFTDITRITAKQKVLGELIKSDDWCRIEIDEYARNQIVMRVGKYIHRRSYRVSLNDVVSIVRDMTPRSPSLTVEECKRIIGGLWPDICDYSEACERRDTIEKHWTMSAIRKTEIMLSLNPKTAFFSRHSMAVAGDTMANYSRHVTIGGAIIVTRKSNGQRWMFNSESGRLTLIGRESN